jgi:hypothetical protein
MSPHPDPLPQGARELTEGDFGGWIPVHSLRVVYIDYVKYRKRLYNCGLRSGRGRLTISTVNRIEFVIEVINQIGGVKGFAGGMFNKFGRCVKTTIFVDMFVEPEAGDGKFSLADAFVQRGDIAMHGGFDLRCIGRAEGISGEIAE